MSLVINHNMMAANTARNLNTHYGNLATSTQRLSSGLRINGAADDAAGLAIRELMRADIAAYNQGIRNANDAISMIQVVDGALGIIDEKLIRMKELAEQAATGTYDSTQRLMIDSEFQAMASEIQRIATATDFNGIKLIDGSSNATNKLDIFYNKIERKIGYNEEINKCTTADNDNAFVLTHINKFYEGKQIEEYYEEYGKIYKKVTNDITITTTTSEKKLNLSGSAIWVNENFMGASVTDYGYDIKPLYPEVINKVQEVQDAYDPFAWPVYDMKPLSITYEYSDPAIGPEWPPTLKCNHIYTMNYDIDNDNEADISLVIYCKESKDIAKLNDNINLHGLNYSAAEYGPWTNITYDDSTSIEEVILPNSDKILIHFGPMNDSAEDYYDIAKRDCTLKGLGLEDVRIKTQDKAQKALVTINDAIVKKDQARAYYGAMQNRLENTVSNLTIQAENLQASESRISDIDVATEMTNFVRNQILTQSAVAMLSQANSMPQMALQLIGG